MYVNRSGHSFQKPAKSQQKIGISQKPRAALANGLLQGKLLRKEPRKITAAHLEVKTRAAHSSSAATALGEIDRPFPRLRPKKPKPQQSQLPAK